MIAVVYDIQSPITVEIAGELEKKGWEVIRCSFADDWEETRNICESADMLVINANLSAAPADTDTDNIGAFVTERIYDIHKMIDAYIPILNKGFLKRIAVISETDSSVRLCKSCTGYAEHMLLTGIHMKLKMLFNTYRQLGFTFRCFALTKEELHQGIWKTGEGISPADYFCMNFSNSAENHLVIRDKWFKEIEW